MAFLVDDLLDFAQLNAGKFRKTVKKFELKEAMEEIMDSWEVTSSDEEENYDEEVTEKYGTEENINTDNRIRNKLGILDLNIIMTHALTFDYFKTYISTQSQDHTVYLNLYCLIQSYRKKLDQMRIRFNMIRKNQGDAFDPKSNEDE